MWPRPDDVASAPTARQARGTGTLAPASVSRAASAGDPLHAAVRDVVGKVTRAMSVLQARMHLTVTERRVGAPRSGQEESVAKRRRGGGAAAAATGLVFVGLALVHALRAQVRSAALLVAPPAWRLTGRPCLSAPNGRRVTPRRQTRYGAAGLPCVAWEASHRRLALTRLCPGAVSVAGRQDAGQRAQEPQGAAVAAAVDCSAAFEDTNRSPRGAPGDPAAA